MKVRVPKCQWCKQLMRYVSGFWMCEGCDLKGGPFLAGDPREETK